MNQNYPRYPTEPRRVLVIKPSGASNDVGSRSDDAQNFFENAAFDGSLIIPEPPKRKSPFGTAFSDKKRF